MPNRRRRYGSVERQLIKLATGRTKTSWAEACSRWHFRLVSDQGVQVCDHCRGVLELAVPAVGEPAAWTRRAPSWPRLLGSARSADGPLSSNRLAGSPYARGSSPR